MKLCLRLLLAAAIASLAPVACSSASTGGGAPGGGPSTSDADGSTSGPEGSDGGAAGDGAVGAVEIPITDFCPRCPDVSEPPPNPDLTTLLPGSQWRPTTACISKWPYLKEVGLHEGDCGYDPEDFKPLSVTGKLRGLLDFSQSQTMTRTIDLDYHVKIDLELGIYVGLDTSCDKALEKLRDLQEGVDETASTCVPGTTNRCTCDIAIKLTLESTGEGYQVMSKNVGVKLASGDVFAFKISDNALTFQLGTPYVAGDIGASMLTATFGKR